MATTAVDPVFVDTNVLIHLNLAGSPWHPAARSKLQGLTAAGHPLWISRQVLREYLAALSRPGAVTPALPMSTLLADVGSFSTRFLVADVKKKGRATFLGRVARPTSSNGADHARVVPPDHDQRLKVLLKEFFEQFFRCFFPGWAERFDFTAIDWLDKELFLAPPQGEKRQLDLVARLSLRPGAPPPSEGATDLVALVHVEVENRPSAAALRPRMFDYYVQLRRDTGLPVWLIGLYLRVGLDGVGWDTYEEFFWEQRILRFEYAYVGLPGLDAERYAAGENLLGVALATLMRIPPERRAELIAEGLQRIAGSGENDWRRFLLAECLEAYADLDEQQKERLQALLASERYQEVRPIMITTYERGRIAGQRETALLLLEARFGPLSPAARERLEALSPEELRQLTLDLLKAQSLKDLRLED